MLAFKLMNRKTILKLLENKFCQLKFKSTLNPIIGTSNEPNFGFLFDIDGVFVRGKTVLKRTKECIDLLTDKNGNFRVPVLFLTNAGNEMCVSKSAKLSAMLNVNIRPEQVVMSHSPLRMATNFHKKHCLISGQGPIVEIAKFLGFNSVITVEDLRLKHPQLDVVDHKRRNFAPCVFSRYMPQIEAIILFGESVRWETNLQLIIDVIMCNGNLESVPKMFPSTNLPILACNTDLLWMAEAAMPRFGHGAFLHCLEQIYCKLSGNELKYSYIVGKPSSLTYFYAESMINKFAKSIGIKSLKRLYAVGDNVDTDVVGANFYNLQLQTKRNIEVESLMTEGFKSEAKSCNSILVRTGVYQGDQTSSNNYSHKDAKIESRQKIPDYICDDVYDAVKMVYEIEKFK